MPKRDRTPEKAEFNSWTILEGEDEDEKIAELLEDEDSYVGDHVHYASNNQMGARSTRIIKDRNGNKRLGTWKYLYDDLAGKILRKHKSRKHKSRKHKSRKHKSRKHKSRKHKSRKTRKN